MGGFPSLSNSTAEKKNSCLRLSIWHFSMDTLKNRWLNSQFGMFNANFFMDQPTI
jgi:hypothetical protein